MTDHVQRARELLIKLPSSAAIASSQKAWDFAMELITTALTQAHAQGRQDKGAVCAEPRVYRLSGPGAPTADYVLATDYEKAHAQGRRAGLEEAAGICEAEALVDDKRGYYGNEMAKAIRVRANEIIQQAKRP